MYNIHFAHFRFIIIVSYFYVLYNSNNSYCVLFWKLSKVVGAAADYLLCNECLTRMTYQ